MARKPADLHSFSKTGELASAQAKRMDNLARLRRTDEQLIDGSRASLRRSYETLEKTAAQVPDPPPRRKS